MESRSARHRHAAAQRTTRARQVLAALVGSGVVAAAAISVARATGDSAADTRTVCVDAVALIAPGLPAAHADAIVAAAADHLGGDCRGVRLAERDEAADAVRLGPPVVDVGAASTQAAPSPDAVSPVARTVATSPVVLAMPTQMATVLGASALDTATLGSLLTTPSAWSALGHPEWGSFTIDSPDPATTALGAAAFAGLAGVANGGPLDGAPDYATPSPGDLAVIKLEHALRTESRTDGTLPTPATVADSAATASAFVTTEADLARYAASSPAVPMTGFPVAGGATVLDWVVSSPSGASPTLRQRTSRIASALASAQGRAALSAAGLRTPSGPAPTPPAPGVSPASLPAPPRSMSAQDIAAVAGQWSLMRTRISTLVVLDTSGSMADPMPGSPAAKIDVVRALATQSYQVASPMARSGIWTFRAESGRPVVTRVAPLQRNDTATGATVHSAASTAALATVPVGGGTPLFEAIRAAYDDATKNYDPDYVNQVLVLTDGKNEQTTSTFTEAQLRAHLARTFDKDRPVRIIAIAFDPSDLGVLTRIVAGTGGKAASAQTMAQVPEAVRLGLFTS
ncbi:MAG TPA: VWA domain-containing protein [Ornithinibacter sp.]|nr:VWA domain-containing protein [Ornithinibacter sp.]